MAHASKDINYWQTFEERCYMAVCWQHFGPMMIPRIFDMFGMQDHLTQDQRTENSKWADSHFQRRDQQLQPQVRKSVAQIQKHLQILVVMTCLSQNMSMQQKKRQQSRTTSSFVKPGAFGAASQGNLRKFRKADRFYRHRKGKRKMQSIWRIPH